MKCDKCQLNEAFISLVDVGDFCLDCHNDLMAEYMGIEKQENFSKVVSFHNSEKEILTFRINNMILPGCSIWKAEELDSGGYLFEVSTLPEADQVAAIKQLHQKILKGINFKTLSLNNNGFYISNAINYKNEQYSLNSVGTLRIKHDERNTVYLVIDGKDISLKDFGNALTAFEGFNLVFQINDRNDEILGKETALKPVSINPDIIYKRFETTLGWFLEGNFLSYKRAGNCEEALFERIEELEVLYRHGKREEVFELAERMKTRLYSIDNDTDNFPDYLIDLINQVVEI